jgi:hypothetical protein
MFQTRRLWDGEWYDMVLEWLSDAISPCSDNREFYSHMPVMLDTKVCGPPRNPKFDNALVHYYCVAEEPWHMYSLIETRWLRRGIGDGWNTFQLRYTNRDGYLECENLVIIYDEMYAMQFKLAFG